MSIPLFPQQALEGLLTHLLGFSPDRTKEVHRTPKAGANISSLYQHAAQITFLLAGNVKCCLARPKPKTANQTLWQFSYWAEHNPVQRPDFSGSVSGYLFVHDPVVYLLPVNRDFLGCGNSNAYLITLDLQDSYFDDIRNPKGISGSPI